MTPATPTFAKNVRRGLAGAFLLTATLAPLCAWAADPVSPPSKNPPASMVHFSGWKRFIIKDENPRVVIWGYIAAVLFPDPDERQKALIQHAITNFLKSPGASIGLLGTSPDDHAQEIFFDPATLNNLANRLQTAVEDPGSIGKTLPSETASRGR